MKNLRIPVQKYTGVYQYKLKNGDISYSITYKDKYSKKVWETIGLKSRGITPTFCSKMRTQRINKIILGEDISKTKAGRRKSVDIKTLNMIFEYYIENKDMKEKTRNAYKGIWKKRFEKNIGEKDINDVTVHEVIELRNKWELSQKTKDTCVGVITSAIRYSKSTCEDFKDIINPLESLKALDKQNLSKAQKREKRNIRDRYLELDEIIELKYALKDDFVLLLAVELMLSTGARISSTLTITKKDVQLSANRIAIIDHKNEGEKYYGFITPTLKNILLEYLPTIKPNTPLISKNGEGIAYSTIAKDLLKILDDLFNEGLDKKDIRNRVVIHTLRHTFASHLAINSTPIFTIQKLMNHKDIEMTMRYAKLSPESGNDAVLGLYN